MSFQTDDLTILALGILGDAPVDPAQPPLPDGIHLRWVFEPEKGFPLHGFSLFRRESRPRDPVCLTSHLVGLRPGSTRSPRFDTRLGRLSSPQPLVWVDEFASTVVQADGLSGLRFDLPPGVDARRVEVTIGFRDTGQPAGHRCVDFRKLPLGFGPNPRREAEVDFDLVLSKASGVPDVSEVEAWSGGPAGLNSGLEARITLPCLASQVDLLLTNARALRIEALSEQGNVLASRELRAGELRTGTVSLTGQDIAQLHLRGEAVDAALLHEICYDCGNPLVDTLPEFAIEVQALSGNAVVAQATVRGMAGQMVPAVLAHDGITAVEIAPGAVALVELCYVPGKRAATFGWEEVPGFQYPLCLPLAHADYPCPGRPATIDDAETLAHSRVTYPAPAGWDQGFPDLHGELAALVQGGPAGGPMAHRVHLDLPGQPLSPATQSDLPKIPGLRPLDLVLLASLQPAVAQMLGLYFVDGSVPADMGYDYLLLADPTGVLGGSAETALAWLAFTPDPSKVDAALVLDRRKEHRPPIAPPGAPRAYALPGMATRAIDGTLRDAVGNIGLTWPLPADPTGVEEPDRILFYLPRRASLGTAEPAAQPALTEYEPLPDLPPVLVSEPDVPAAPGPRIPDWPPPSVALYVVDANRPEGWYSYRLAGQDLFGRHSPLGPPSEWYQWDPPAGTAAPWYYKLPAGHRSIHSFAIALLDKIPPSPPLGIEAWALDPLDRWVLEDAPYTKWRNDNGDHLVGLRVRWRWTLLQQIQAPDTREFRIYYQPGRWNALLGTIVKVTAASDTESDVELDLASSHAPGTFAGTRLRVGNDDFAVLGSQPGAHLRLRVRNIGVHDEIRPAEGKPCTVSIPEQHQLWLDTGLAKTWAQRLAHVDYDPPARTVVDPSKDGNGRLLTDEAFAAAVTVNGKTAMLPLNADLSGIQPWIDHLWLEDGDKAEQTHRILGYDARSATLTLETAPTLGPPVHWIVGRPVREYDVFLPAPDVGDGHPFEPSLAEPVVYAQVAVSAADDKTHVNDDPKWSDPARFGNESRLSPSATVYRVLQTPPKAPELPELPERLVATKADYHSRSYATFRFKLLAHLKIHILRALDDSLFQRDWLIRETRKVLDPAKHDDVFPDGWDAARRQAAVDALETIAVEADYATLPSDAWEVLALLPGNEGAGAALEARDWLVRRTHGAVAVTDTDLFPSYWNSATRQAAASAVNALGGPADYPALSDNALRLLAGLPGNEAAFTQVTLRPFEMTDAEVQDQRRPDDDAAYTPNSALRAYMDTLPGRATNRYFYRASFVDGAQNQSALSLAGPPVYLPKVELPRTPVVTKILGGDRTVTLAWAARAGAEVAEYRVYRADDARRAADTRSMELVATVPRSQIDPAKPAVEWTDGGPLIAGREYFYRLTAVDETGQESPATKPSVAIAVDTRVPEPPVWTDQTWLIRRDSDGALSAWPADGVVPAGHRAVLRLGWQTDAPAPWFVLSRRQRGEPLWIEAASGDEQAFATATADEFTWLATTADPANPGAYRLRVRSSAGVWSTQLVDMDISPPEAE